MGLREQGYVRAVCWLAPSLSLVATIDRRCRARIPLPVWFLVYCGLPPCLPFSTAAPPACSPCAGLRAHSPLPACPTKSHLAFSRSQRGLFILANFVAMELTFVVSISRTVQFWCRDCSFLQTL